MAGHREVDTSGLLPMRAGHSRPTGACTCGWHSHTKTFREHIDNLEQEQR